MAKQMHLAHILSGTGAHVGGWRMPGAEFGTHDFDFLNRTVATAERGKFDLVFIADAVNTGVGVPPNMAMRFEPLTAISALAVTTSHIGLVVTVSTTFSEPYNVARALASIDHLSGGRAGWNVVTSVSEDAALNFGMTLPPAAERYEIAEEYVAVTKGLWDSWEEDALVADREAGIWVDYDKLHFLNHKGKHFSVKGPLNVGRPPQGYPVIFQAGASESGIRVAGLTADVVFTAQQTQEEAIAFKAKIADAARNAGRDPDSIKVICGICPFVADSKEDARKTLSQLANMVDLAATQRLLLERTGYDMLQFPLDEPVPDLPLSPNGAQGHAKQLFALVKRENLTVRQLIEHTAVSSGHRLVLGTAAEVADDMESWFKAGAADGFMIMTPYIPAPLTRFVDEVVPILQERGLFRKDYTETTLRGHLGLSRPPHPATLRRQD